MTVDAASLLESDHRDLDDLLLQFTTKLGVDPQEAFRSLDLFWARLAVHIRAEHLVVFPAILGVAAGRDQITEILKTLRLDHDFFMKELARCIKAMRLMFYFGNETETVEVVSTLIDGLSSKLVEHNRIEEELIYPLVSARIAGDSYAGLITEKARKELNNLPPRLREAATDKSKQ